MLQVLTAGLILGLISSFHCVGMCGPLALSLPVQHLNKLLRTGAILLYNTGRIFTYSLLGLFFGLVGRKVYIAGLQQYLSIALGVIILFFCIEYFIRKNTWQPLWLQRVHLIVQNMMGHFLRSSNIFSFFMLGAANGLLPCGMVYMAIAGALSSSQVMHSVLFMSAFGAGTMPAMMLLSIVGLKVSLNARNQVKKMMPYAMMLISVVLILRGMNLGIPYISPVLAHTNPDAVLCR